MFILIGLVVLLAVALAAPGLLMYQLNKKLNSDLEHFNNQLANQRIERHGNYFIARTKEQANDSKSIFS